ncbi:MAG TPA: hypothetical protein VMT61_01050, partial [Candidatus Binataceae bacterium]|nr:hypothetical protein [Candidatus Binataceae bacterium]
MEAASGFEPLHRGFADLSIGVLDPKKSSKCGPAEVNAVVQNHEFLPPFSESSRTVGAVPD